MSWVEAWSSRIAPPSSIIACCDNRGKTAVAIDEATMIGN